MTVLDELNEIKDVECLEQLQLKITELKNKDSLYLIEVKEIQYIQKLKEYTEDMGFPNVIFCQKMPKIKEIKKVGKE